MPSAPLREVGKYELAKRSDSRPHPAKPSEATVMDRAEEFVWRGDGEEAELSVVAPDEATARFAFGRGGSAGRLPGAVSPVWVAASSRSSFGWVAVSGSHAVPDLASIPSRSVFLVADVPAASLAPSKVGEMEAVLRAGIPDLNRFRINVSGVRKACEFGAEYSAGNGVIEEDDLAFLAPLSTDSDSLGRRAVTAGEREWDEGFDVRMYEVGEVFDGDGADSVGVERGMLAFEVSAGAGELGRISASLHRERLVERVENGEFDSPEDLPSAPLETGEARDLLAASRAAANFADARISLAVYALRRAMREVAGNLGIRASWRVGGFGETGELVAHRARLAAVGEGGAVVSGGVLSGGVGTMYAHVPPFGTVVEDGRWLWEEAGVSERWAGLESPGGEGGRWIS